MPGLELISTLIIFPFVCACCIPIRMGGDHQLVSSQAPGTGSQPWMPSSSTLHFRAFYPHPPKPGAHSNLASQLALRVPHLRLLNAGMSGLCHAQQLLCGIWGSQLRSSCFCDKGFYLLSHLPSPTIFEDPPVPSTGVRRGELNWSKSPMAPPLRVSDRVGG